LWNLFNGHHKKGEHFRVFPLINWTELDIWKYIETEGIQLPSLYFAHKRNVINRNGTLYSMSDFLTPSDKESVTEKMIRFRTIGDMTCTGAVESSAVSIADIIKEIIASTVTERGTRIDDQRSETAMEDRKRQGYF
jgi:sulfate adenylyltransferase subunit 2